MLGCALADARTKRSKTAKAKFIPRALLPYHWGSEGACKGIVIGYIVPIACGGVDAPRNMQWQTVADAKAKDKSERKGCRK